MTFSQTMIRELRSLRVAVFHPADADRDELMLHIRRIGCTVYADWPIPSRPARETDIALCLLSETGAALPDWPEVPLIAILEYESPIIVRSLLDSNAHGIVTKPIRAFGILSTLLLTRSLHRFGQRQKAKTDRLEETLRSRRLIDRAAEALAASGFGTLETCHQAIRRAAMAGRVTAASLAGDILAGKTVAAIEMHRKS